MPSNRTTFADPYYEQLLEGRTINVMGTIEPALAARVVAELQYLQHDNGKRMITLEVFSPGGDVHSGLAIIDAARSVGCPIRTVGLGLCASMGAVILACAADKGERYLTANTEVMLHQVLSGFQGQQSDIQIAAEHIKALRDRLDVLLARAMAMPPSEVHELTDRDRWLSAEEAVELGVADHVIRP